MSILIPILIVFHVAICLLMVLVVLMQRPRSEGLGAAFGGGMTDNLFGAQTTHVLQKFTVWLGGGFFALTLLLAILYSKATAGPTPIQLELTKDAPEETSSALPEASEKSSETPAATVGETVIVEEVEVPVQESPVELGEAPKADAAVDGGANAPSAQESEASAAPEAAPSGQP